MSVRQSAVADLRFPRQMLLKLDPQLFRNVLNTCADAPVFANVEAPRGLIAKCVEDKDERNELGPLLIAFVVGLLQKGSIPKDVFIFTQLIKRVLQRQFMNVRAQKQAELHIVDFLRVVPEIDMDIVLDVAQKQPHIYIGAYIFTLRKQYVQLLECCLGDAVDPPPEERCIASLLELAASRPAEERHGDWLAKLFRHLLKALPEATSIDDQSNGGRAFLSRQVLEAHLHALDDLDLRTS
ncbi:hypothetical protein GPALN_004390 [Globodera pallida]|nr:hypothetical protein GPALN_004390 [Globodera pallida]